MSQQDSNVGKEVAEPEEITVCPPSCLWVEYRHPNGSFGRLLTEKLQQKLKEVPGSMDAGVELTLNKGSDLQMIETAFDSVSMAERCQMTIFSSLPPIKCFETLCG